MDPAFYFVTVISIYFQYLVLEVTHFLYWVSLVTRVFAIRSIIFDRLSNEGRFHQEITSKHLNDYGDAGLRTLALSYKKLDQEEYNAWNEEFVKAKTSIGANREILLEKASDLMEKDLILVGATAVEDKLQKGVTF